MFREDIQDTQAIRDIGNMKILGNVLQSKVGSLLSLNAIREDLEVSFRAVSHWMDILESFYYCFRVYPYSAKKYDLLKKSPSFFCGIGQRLRMRLPASRT